MMLPDLRACMHPHCTAQPPKRPIVRRPQPSSACKPTTISLAGQGWSGGCESAVRLALLSSLSALHGNWNVACCSSPATQIPQGFAKEAAESTTTGLLRTESARFSQFEIEWCSDLILVPASARAHYRSS